MGNPLASDAVGQNGGVGMLKALGKVPHTNQLGTAWEYSLSTDVLGLMLERVAEKPLDPLGMADTRLVVPAAKPSTWPRLSMSSPRKRP